MIGQDISIVDRYDITIYVYNSYVCVYIYINQLSIGFNNNVKNHGTRLLSVIITSIITFKIPTSFHFVDWSHEFWPSIDAKRMAIISPRHESHEFHPHVSAYLLPTSPRLRYVLSGWPMVDPWLTPQKDVFGGDGFSTSMLQDGAPKIVFSCLKKVAEFYGLW